MISSLTQSLAERISGAYTTLINDRADNRYGDWLCLWIWSSDATLNYSCHRTDSNCRRSCDDCLYKAVSTDAHQDLKGAIFVESAAKRYHLGNGHER